MAQGVFKFELDFAKETRIDVRVSPSKIAPVTSTFAPSGQNGPTGPDALTVTPKRTKHVVKEKDSDFVARRTAVLARLLNTIRYTNHSDQKPNLSKCDCVLVLGGNGHKLNASLIDYETETETQLDLGAKVPMPVSGLKNAKRPANPPLIITHSA